VALVTGSVLTQLGRGLRATVLLGLLVGLFDFLMNFLQMAVPRTELGWVPDLVILAGATIAITVLDPRGDRSLASSVSDAPHDALQRLERRVEVLEQMMRRLVAPGAAAERISAAPQPAAVASPPTPLARPQNGPTTRRQPPRPPTSSNGSASVACYSSVCSRCSRQQASS